MATWRRISMVHTTGNDEDNEELISAGVGLLLIVSFTAFYNLAWIYFRERLFPHHNFALPQPVTGKKARGGDAVERRKTLSLRAAGRAFSGTFALSSCILELMILEVAGLHDPVSSALAWRACLGVMVLGLHTVLPFLLAYACLGELGLGRRSSALGATVLLLLALMFTSRLSPPQPFAGDSPAAAGDGAETGFGTVRAAFLLSLLSLEAGLERIGVIGVASVALLSGFGAVNLPYQQLAKLLRNVPSSLIHSREERARRILRDIGHRKRQALTARAASGGREERRGDYGRVVATRGRSRGPGLITNLMRVMAPGSSQSNATQAFEAETANLEEIVRELFLEIVDCRRIREQQRRARTPGGVILVAFGGIMFLFCLLRLWKAGVKILWTPLLQSFLDAPETDAAGVAGAGEGRGGSAGGADDPASRLVTFALSQKLLLDGDAEGWSELISFVLVGILVLVQTRGFLETVMTVNKASMMSGVSIPAQVLSVLLSILMGTYFTSSVILMRVNLPPRHRMAITAALGGMRFSFYERWFDTVFLVSGCTTAVTLMAFHLANRKSDADDADGTNREQSRLEGSAGFLPATAGFSSGGDRSGHADAVTNVAWR